MGAYMTYTDTLPRFFDTQQITTEKILQALNNGAGGGGGSPGTGTLSGSGVPSNGIGSNGDIYIDLSNRDLYVKISNVWELWVDMV